MKTLSDIDLLLKQVKRKLEKIFGHRLSGVILYGSYARKEAREDCDIDLILLIVEMKNPVEELKKCQSEIHKIDFEYDRLVSLLPIDATEYKTKNTPFLLNVKKEGILL